MAEIFKDFHGRRRADNLQSKNKDMKAKCFFIRHPLSRQGIRETGLASSVPGAGFC